MDVTNKFQFINNLLQIIFSQSITNYSTLDQKIYVSQVIEIKQLIAHTIKLGSISQISIVNQMTIGQVLSAMDNTNLNIALDQNLREYVNSNKSMILKLLNISSVTPFYVSFNFNQETVQKCLNILQVTQNIQFQNLKLSAKNTLIEVIKTYQIVSLNTIMNCFNLFNASISILKQIDKNLTQEDINNLNTKLNTMLNYQKFLDQMSISDNIASYSNYIIIGIIVAIIILIFIFIIYI